ncbi:MAG: dipicolinate synthase subunit B [Halanaerobiaceae bacterium]|mgnify:FL=1|nr:dipicolinate synthase subunit B [Halanaerobiaceae bacterium]
MLLQGKKIGYAITGSFCTLDKTIQAMEDLIKVGAELIPIVSEPIRKLDTKYGAAREWLDKIKGISGNDIIDSIVKAEPIGPEKLLDLLIIAPCTGNTLGKLANGIIDETVVMAAKAHLRNERPVLIAIATNDGLGLNARNLGVLLNTKNVFFVPFGQDNPLEKKNSLVARFDLIKKAAEYALDNKQIQPVLIEYRGI